MIKFNETLCLDLKDEFEYYGLKDKLFTLTNFIHDTYCLGNGLRWINRAFIFGYCWQSWIKDLWFPPNVRIALRHLTDNLDIEAFNNQIAYLNSNYLQGDTVNIEEYANYILKNCFVEGEHDLNAIAILLGQKLRENVKS